MPQGQFENLVLPGFTISDILRFVKASYLFKTFLCCNPFDFLDRGMNEDFLAPFARLRHLAHRCNFQRVCDRRLEGYHSVSGGALFCPRRKLKCSSTKEAQSFTIRTQKRLRPRTTKWYRPCSFLSAIKRSFMLPIRNRFRGHVELRCRGAKTCRTFGRSIAAPPLARSFDGSYMDLSRCCWLAGRTSKLSSKAVVA